MSTKIISPADAIAWFRLIEMEGCLSPFTDHQGGRKWSCHAPRGTTTVTGNPDLIVEYDEDPAVAIARVHETWVALGRPARPVLIDIEIGDDDPDWVPSRGEGASEVTRG